MKKLIFLLVCVCSIFFYQEMFAADCKPCDGTWVRQTNIDMVYNSCTYTIVFDKMDCNDGKCYFHIYQILDINNCGGQPNPGAIIYAACVAIINSSATNDCWPTEANDCVESVENYNASCWKWELISPYDQGYKLIECGNISCCETHWMLCLDENGRKLAPYITYQRVTDPCDAPPVGCSNTCPEYP